MIASTTRRASALDGRRQPRSFAKRYWRKCDDTPTLSSTRVAVHVSLTAGANAGELANALKEAIGIPRTAARKRVERLLTLGQMLAEYVGLYARAIEAVGEGFDVPDLEAFQLPPAPNLTPALDTVASHQAG